MKYILLLLVVNCYKINIENIIFKNKFINFKITHKNSSINNKINLLNKNKNFNNLDKNLKNLKNSNIGLNNLDNDRLKILLPNTLILKKKFDESYPILSIDFGNRIGLSFNYFNEIELFNIKFTNYQQTTQEIIKIINYIKYKFILHQIFILLGFPFIPNLYHTEWDLERDVEGDVQGRSILEGNVQESDVLGNRKCVYTDLRLLYQILFTLDFGLYLAYYVNCVTGSGSTATTPGKGANDTFSTIGKRANFTPMECTPGKGANFTPMECTPGKGANFTPMECTRERELTTAMECTTKDIGAEGTTGRGPHTVTDVTENFITKCIYCKLFGNKKCIFGGNCINNINLDNYLNSNIILGTSEHFTTYQISLFNSSNTVLGQTGKGANSTAMECTMGKRANDTFSTLGKRANDTFNTLGKRANFTAMECTPGKGANFMGMECTMGKRANFMGMECTKGTLGTTGAVGASTVTGDTVTGNKDNKSSINIYKNLMNIKENFIILPNKNNIFNNTRSNNILLYQNIKNKLIKSIQ